MRRRAFLRGMGAAGGAALGAGLPRASAAGRARPSERLRKAQVTVTARLSRADAGTVVTSDVPLGATAGTRRPIAGGGNLAISATAVPSRPEAIDLLASFRHRGRPAETAIAIELGLGRWSREAYLVLPGACYAANRFESRHVSYPPLLSEPADIGPNVPPIVSDIPRLNLHAGPSGLACPSLDLAAPAAGLFLPAAQLGLIVLFDPTTTVGVTGLRVSESDDRAAASLTVGAPFGFDDRRPRTGDGAPDPGAFLRDGAQLALRARVYLFDCPDVPALFARLFGVRKELTGPTPPVHELPFSAAFAAHEERVNRRWLQTPGLFMVGGRSSAYSTWQTGWGSSLAGLAPLLATGAPVTRERARQTAAFVVSEGQAPSGFFHALTDGRTWFEDGFTAPLPSRGSPTPPYRNAQRWHLVRRSADALVCLMKQLAVLERHPNPRASTRLETDIAEAARRAADAFVRLWDRYHQLGQFVEIDSGALLVGGSTSAGAAPAGLALAAAYFKHDDYLRVARGAAEQYHDRYVRAGLTCGGPGDALQCPDSQSAAGLLESFVTLYEATRDRIWIDRARDAAHLLASWVIAYEPPPGGGARRDLCATGGVLSDAQNAGGTPGYLLWSGDALFRLYRATGEVALLELLRDTVSNLSQYLRCAPGPDPAANAPRPTASGRGARTDTRRWLEQPGEIVPAGGAFDAIALLAYTEVPGLYARLDSGFVFAFDHLEARVKERLAGKLVVSLSNRTRADASVRIYAESASDADEPLRPGAVVDAPTARVPAGATIDLPLPLARAPGR